MFESHTTTLPGNVSEYTYVRLRDAMADFLGHNIRMDTVSSDDFSIDAAGNILPKDVVTKLTECSRFATLYHDSQKKWEGEYSGDTSIGLRTFVIIVIDWSDDVEPLIR